MQTAVSYLRVSSPGQAKPDRDGFKRQRETIRKFCEREQITLAEEFSDVTSGDNSIEDRTNFGKMLVYCETNKCKIIIIENADRIARDLMVQELLINETMKLGEMSILSAESGQSLVTSSDDPTRKLIRQLLGAVAEFEKNRLVLKLRAARQRIRAKQGRCEGRKRLESVQSMQPVLKKLSYLRNRSLTSAEIAETLNAEGYRTPDSKIWTPSNVRSTLLRLRKRGAISI